ncbi:uncharacterized protein LOC105829637 [Monomorium pharaonis]|uniref:uncharacterized protein LOC105829637 n=1 Tax=Monomorium pharaonis TaxID=307658 RepID=UPI00063FC74B|nr:uncharacterized protein LOC105829637 [Monomorium pharaonis]
MRIAVTLSLLAAFCTVESIPAWSTDLEVLRTRIRDLKWNVETIIRHLELLGSMAEDDTVWAVSLKWNKEQDHCRMLETELRTVIRKEVDAAKADGKKDVEACYKEAVDGISATVKKSHEEAAKCGETAKDKIHNDLSFINNLISTAELLLVELENIILDCYDSDIHRMQSCIHSELAKAENSLRTLESDIITAEKTVHRVSDNVVMQAGNCIEGAYSTLRTSGPVVKMGVNKCILKKY